MEYQQIWNQQQIQSALSPGTVLSYPLGTIAAESIRIDNVSTYGLKVMDVNNNQLDYLDPNTFVITNFISDSTLVLDITHTSVMVPPQMYVAVTFYPEAMPTQRGAVASNGTLATSTTVQGDVNATIQNAQLDVNVTNASIPVSGNVSANITNASIPVSGGVEITGGTMDVNLQGTPTFNLAAGTNVGISGGTVEVSAGSIQVTNPVQTNALVKLGTTQFNVFDLANSGSLNLLVAGVATGYFQTIVLEGTSANGYTYTATANAYNRNTNIGSAALTQSNGPSGEFYASGNLSSKQSFGNVQVGLTAQTTTSATIFNDNMQAGTNWATKSGAVTYGANGATFGANGTLITETQTPQLAPQNLTVQASAQVQNTSVTNTVNGANVGQGTASTNVSTSAYNTTSTNANYSYGSSFTVSKTTTLTGIGIFFNSTGSVAITLKVWDSAGNVLASAGLASITSGNFNYVSFSPITLQPGNTYYVGFTAPGSSISFDYNNGAWNTTITGNGVTISEGSILYSNSTGGLPNVQVTSVGGISVGFTVQYPVALDTSIGARPVLLSNGWLISAGANPSNGNILFMVSKDNGQSWNLLTTWAQTYSGANVAITSKGTTVYVLYNYGSGTFVYFTSFDATTVGANVVNTANPDSGQTSFGSGCDLKYKPADGSLHATWCSKNSAYPNSVNLRYSNSVDGGNTWISPVQVTLINTANQYAQNPRLILVNGVPAIISEYNAGSYAIGIFKGDTSLSSSSIVNTNWSYSNVTPGVTYTQNNATAVVRSDGSIVATWNGTDATYSNAQVKTSFSTDGGKTWSSSVNIAPASGGFNVPTITVDPANKVYVLSQSKGNNTLFMSTSTDAITWSAWQQLSSDNASNPQALYPTSLNFSSPLFVYMDNTANYTKFAGTWLIGSHSTVGVEYWKDSQNYYQLQWSAGNLNLIKVVGGTQSTITTATVNEQATTVTLKLVVASNGNLTGTLSGAGTNSVTGTDTTVTLGSLGITGDNGVVVTNGFISGNYIPSDTVTVDVYAI